MASEMDRLKQAAVAETKRVGPLMQGAIDLHYHGYPEMTLRVQSRLDDVEVLKLGRELGMRGIVIKSQMWPTMGRSHYLRQQVPGIECFASITLNAVAGGLNPWVVDAAGRQGAKVVWLPTWSSAHLTGQVGFSKMMKGWFPSMTFEPSLCCVDSSGRFTLPGPSSFRVSCRVAESGASRSPLQYRER